MRLAIASLALVAFVGFGTTTYAQVPSNPTLLEAVQALQSSVATLQASINALSAATSQGNTRFTPPGARHQLRRKLRRV